MADMAIARVKSSDTKRWTELAELRSLAQKAVGNLACHLSKLPIETIVVIFTMVIGESNTVMLRLMSVCRDWRELIVDTPSFWGRLTITGKSRQKKIDTWMERSRGRLLHLYLSRTFDFRARPNVFRSAPPTVWSHLRGLQLENCNLKGDLDTHLPDGAVSSLQLKVLRMKRKLDGTLLEADLRGIDAASLEELSISTKFAKFPPSFAASCGNLVRLHLVTDVMDAADLFPVLESARKLEFLLIHKGSSGITNLSLSRLSLERLAQLRCLDIAGYSLDGLWASIGHLPKIEVVAVSRGYDCPSKADTEQLTMDLPLEELRFAGYYFSVKMLAPLLQRCPSLSTLRVDGCDCVSDRGEVSVLERLADANCTLCPRLEHLEWSSSSMVKAGAVVRFVKARLARLPTPGNADAESEQAITSDHTQIPLPLQSLILDDCLNMDPMAIPWLRSNVPMFSCRRTK